MLLFSHPLSNLKSSHARKSLSSCLFSTVGLIQLSEADSHADSRVNPRFYLPGWQVGGELGSKLRSRIAVLPERSLRHGSGQITYLECQLAPLCVASAEVSQMHSCICQMLHRLKYGYLLSTNIIHTLFSTADLHSLGWFLQVPKKYQPLKSVLSSAFARKKKHLL